MIFTSDQTNGLPLTSNPAAAVRIMWTNTRGWPDRLKEFTVNHFVPLFTRGSNVVNSNDGWTYVTRRKSMSSAKAVQEKKD